MPKSFSSKIRTGLDILAEEPWLCGQAKVSTAEGPLPSHAITRMQNPAKRHVKSWNIFLTLKLWPIMGCHYWFKFSFLFLLAAKLEAGNQIFQIIAILYCDCWECPLFGMLHSDFEHQSGTSLQNHNTAKLQYTLSLQIHNPRKRLGI